MPVSQSRPCTSSQSLWSVLDGSVNYHHSLTQGLCTNRPLFVSLGVSSGKWRGSRIIWQCCGCYGLTQGKWPPNRTLKAFIKQLCFLPTEPQALRVPSPSSPPESLTPSFPVISTTLYFSGSQTWPHIKIPWGAFKNTKTQASPPRESCLIGLG